MRQLSTFQQARTQSTVVITGDPAGSSPLSSPLTQATDNISVDSEAGRDTTHELNGDDHHSTIGISGMSVQSNINGDIESGRDAEDNGGSELMRVGSEMNEENFIPQLGTLYICLTHNTILTIVEYQHVEGPSTGVLLETTHEGVNRNSELLFDDEQFAQTQQTQTGNEFDDYWRQLMETPTVTVQIIPGLQQRRFEAAVPTQVLLEERQAIAPHSWTITTALEDRTQPHEQAVPQSETIVCTPEMRDDVVHTPRPIDQIQTQIGLEEGQGMIHRSPLTSPVADMPSSTDQRAVSQSQPVVSTSSMMEDIDDAPRPLTQRQPRNARSTHITIPKFRRPIPFPRTVLTTQIRPIVVSMFKCTGIISPNMLHI